MTKKILTYISFLSCINTTIIAQHNTVNSKNTKKYDPSTNLVIWPDEFNPEKAQWYVYNEIEINATPEVVWNIIIDAKKWHTFYKGVERPVQFIDGDAASLRNGQRFRMQTMGLRIEPVIKEYVPNERMAWEVRKGSLKAYHAWIIVPTANGCRLITPEAQNGFLTFMQRIFQPDKLLDLHQYWLGVIKSRAEQTTPQLNETEKTGMKGTLTSSMVKFNLAIHNLSKAQLNFKSAPDKWSIAECIEHITLVELEFPKILERELQRPSDPTLRSNIRIQDDEIKPKMTSRKWKAESLEIFQPANKFATTRDAINTFQNQRNQTINYIETTKDDLRNHYWTHPLTGKIDLYQTLLLMSAHLDRHTEQIETIKSSEYFPKN